MKNRVKRALLLLLALTLMPVLAACGDGEQRGQQDSNRLTVICSIYPVYDFTRQIAHGHADVYQMLPKGMDSHDYEPSVGDMVAASRADLFIYTDDEMETWIGGIKGSLGEEKLFRCAGGIDLEALNEEWERIEHENEGEDEEEHHHEHKYDAHIWLDPTLAVIMCENIRDRLIALDPANSDDYTSACLALTDEIMALDADFEALFQAHPQAVLCFGGSFSYSHFIRRYGVKYLSAYDGCGENEEVNLGRLIGITRLMQDTGAKYVFTDELSDGLIAGEISRKTGARILLFHSCHTVSGSDAASSYTDLMRRNYDNVRRALGEG